MSQTTIHVETDVNPTESEEKIQKAIWNIFGDLNVEINLTQRGKVLSVDAKGLDGLSTLRSVLRKDHIRDASRKALFRGLLGTTLIFYLNKQVAFSGHVSFSEAEAESPLGPIKVTIKTDDPQQLIDWLAPRTSKP
jgi:predicted RNA binding protein with dsRBD fold (UPF0201 family)